jgi:ammonia channel protein AmtB
MWASAGSRNYDLMTMGNGALAGLVAITAPCSTIEPWAALIVGFVAGILYCIGSKVWRRLTRLGASMRCLGACVCLPWVLCPCGARSVESEARP